jgi:hypothetical protein
MSDAFNRVTPGADDELVTVRLPRSVLNQLLQEQTMSGSNNKSAAATAANDTSNSAANASAAEDQLRGETVGAIDEQLGQLGQERAELEGRLAGVTARIKRLVGARETAKGEGEEAAQPSSFGRKFAKVSLVVLGVGAACYGGVLAYKRWAPQG